MTKREELMKYSNPAKVRKNARFFFGEDIKIRISTRKNKKYMIEDPDGKWVHFGAWGMEDYTLHRDKDRLRAFRSRNRAWRDAPTYSPRYLSYWLLWR